MMDRKDILFFFDKFKTKATNQIPICCLFCHGRSVGNQSKTKRAIEK